MKTIIVAGCGRSGMTAIMQMLHAGGYPCFGTYPAFEDKQLTGKEFFEHTGKAIKVVDTVRSFPPTGDYHVIFSVRDLKQQALSTIKFARMVSGIHISNKDVPRFMRSIEKDQINIRGWAKRQSGYMAIHFEDIIKTPGLIAIALSILTGEDLNQAKMIAAIKPRGTECYNGLMELEIVREHLIATQHGKESI